MKVGSLFSGCGLADYGLHQAGFELAWACEIEKQPRAVLRRHFPKAEIHFDVKEMTGGTLEPVELLFFGSPCQDLSVAGKRAGLAGERSGLFAEAMRIVDEMDAPPRICVWENVCGALSSNKGADFATVLTEMGKRWSGVAYRVLDLQWFGVPQRRRRVFVVGHSGGWRSAAEILFEREGLRRNPPTRRKAGEGFARDVAPSIGANYGKQPDSSDTSLGPMLLPVIYQDSEFGCKPYGTAGSMRAGRIPEHQMVLEPVCYGLQTDVTPKFNENLSFTLKQPSKSGGGQPAAVAIQEVGKRTGKSTTDPRAGIGISAPGDPMYTLQSGAQHGVGVGMAVRRLTPTECERLMGAPDGYTAWGIDGNGKRVDMADGPRYKMIGNGVGVPHSRWIGKRALASLNK